MVNWSGWLVIQDPNEKLEEDTDGIESLAGEDLDPVSTPKSPRQSGTFPREIETSPSEARIVFWMVQLDVEKKGG